jgi:hypothetical protein
MSDYQSCLHTQPFLGLKHEKDQMVEVVVSMALIGGFVASPT